MTEFISQDEAAQMKTELEGYRQAARDAEFKTAAENTGYDVIKRLQPYLRDDVKPEELAQLFGDTDGEEAAALEKRGLLNDANNDRVKELQAKLIETEQLARSTGSADLRVQASTIRRELAGLQS